MTKSWERTIVETFDPCLERWEEQPTCTTGAPPDSGRLLHRACVSLNESLYTYGGYNGIDFDSSVHRLNCDGMEWTELEQRNPQDGPMWNAGSGMVSYSTDTFALFGGYGFCSEVVKSGTFVRNGEDFAGGGWTDEFYLFNVKKR